LAYFLIFTENSIFEMTAFEKKLRGMMGVAQAKAGGHATPFTLSLLIGMDSRLRGDDEL